MSTGHVCHDQQRRRRQFCQYRWQWDFLAGMHGEYAAQYRDENGAMTKAGLIELAEECINDCEEHWGKFNEEREYEIAGSK